MDAPKAPAPVQACRTEAGKRPIEENPLWHSRVASVFNKPSRRAKTLIPFNGEEFEVERSFPVYLRVSH